MGSCAEYLHNTVSHLEERGIRDRNLWKLQQLVAAKIMSLNASSGGEETLSGDAVADRPSDTVR